MQRPLLKLISRKTVMGLSVALPPKSFPGRSMRRAPQQQVLLQISQDGCRLHYWLESPWVPLCDATQTSCWNWSTVRLLCRWLRAGLAGWFGTWRRNHSRKTQGMPAVPGNHSRCQLSLRDPKNSSEWISIAWQCGFQLQSLLTILLRFFPKSDAWGRVCSCLRRNAAAGWARWSTN